VLLLHLLLHLLLLQLLLLLLLMAVRQRHEGAVPPCRHATAAAAVKFRFKMQCVFLVTFATSAALIV
jgi:hypothetical protein